MSGRCLLKICKDKRHELSSFIGRKQTVKRITLPTINRIGYNFEMYKKEKSCKSLTYRTLSNALQDGLEPEYMKLTEIIRNYKKLNTNKLHKMIER